MILEAVLFHTLLGTGQPPAPLFLVVDQGSESAAAVVSAMRFEPATGRLSTATRDDAEGWSRTRHEIEVGASRSRFVLDFDPAAGRLVWRASAGAPVIETLVPSAAAIAGPNLLRLELANFDRSGSLAVERLELEVGEERRELGGMGHGSMSRDLATLFAPALAGGFRLTGELVLHGAPVAPGRLFVDFGLGRGRRVEVEVDGEGDVESVPPRLARSPRRKSAIGYFAPDEKASLRAIGGRFREWESVDGASSAREVDLNGSSGSSFWSARFEPAGGGDAIDHRASEHHSGATPHPEGSINFANPAAILVPGGQPGTTTGKASPYPSEITVGGPVTGGLSDLDVLLKGVSHSFPDDLDVVVVSPHGTALLVLSDACGLTDVIDVDWRFDADAAAALPDSGPCISGNFKLSAYDGTSDTFDAPAPPGPYVNTFDSLLDENVNGTWQLYVFDDGADDVGSIAGGWELAFNTFSAAIDIPGTGSSGVADPYPYTRTIAADEPLEFGSIVDLNVVVSSLWHQFPADIDLLLVAPNGDTVMLMSDACGGTEVEAEGVYFDDEADAPLTADASGCWGVQGYRPTDYGSPESLPAPAPAGPYGATLSVFDGDPVAGTWKLFVRDDGEGDVGFVSNFFQLVTETNGIFQSGFEGDANDLCYWTWSPNVPGCVG